MLKWSEVLIKIYTNHALFTFHNAPVLIYALSHSFFSPAVSLSNPTQALTVCWQNLCHSQAGPPISPEMCTNVPYINMSLLLTSDMSMINHVWSATHNALFLCISVQGLANHNVLMWTKVPYQHIATCLMNPLSQCPHVDQGSLPAYSY